MEQNAKQEKVEPGVYLHIFYQSKSLNIPIWVPKKHSPKKVPFGFKEELDCTVCLENLRQIFQCSQHFLFSRSAFWLSRLALKMTGCLDFKTSLENQTS